MQIVKVQPDASEVVVASDLSAAEFDGLREWFCYTKPLGGGIKLIGRASPDASSDFGIRIAGTEPEPDRIAFEVPAETP